MPIGGDNPNSPNQYIADDGAGGGEWYPTDADMEGWGVDETEDESEGKKYVDYTTKTCRLIIKYYANGASGNPPSDSTATYSGKKKPVSLDAMVKDQGSSMTKQGYSFLGWSTSNGSNNTVNYNPGDVIKKDWTENASGDTVYNLYAVWTDQGRFVYKPGEYANEAKNQYHDKYAKKPLNQAVNLAGVIFTRTGYNLVGWKNSSGTHIGNINASYTSTSSSDLILYPEWEAKTYTLTFKPNGVSGSDITLTATYDAEVTIPDDLTFTKTGYHISVWNEKANGTETSWFPGKTYIFTRTNDITLYAIWAGNEYYVIYADENTEIIDGDDAIINVKGIINYPHCSIDENNILYSTSQTYGLYIDSNDLLYTAASDFVIDSADDLYENYTIATYGSEFYTEYRPDPKEYRTFNGWETSDGIPLIKTDYCLDSYTISSDAIWRITNNVVLRPVWSDKYPFGKIFYGKKETPDYGIIIEEPPAYYWPEKDLTHFEIKGKNGDTFTDANRYKNIEKKYKIAVYDKNRFGDAAKRLSEFLHRYNNYSQYLRLEDTYENDIYMLGVYEEANSLENILNQAGKGEITFNCKPQKFLLSGNKRIDLISSPTTITNPTSYPAYPIIRVLGTGTITFTGKPARTILKTKAPSKTISLVIYNNFNEIVLDCEDISAADVNGNNANPYLSLTDRIALYPGANTIRFNGDFKSISIIPRWWRL